MSKLEGRSITLLQDSGGTQTRQLPAQTLHGSVEINNMPVGVQVRLNDQPFQIGGYTPPIVIAGDRMDEIAQHMLMRKIKGLASRQDPELEQAFLACCRRDGTWYSGPLDLSVNSYKSDCLEFLGYEDKFHKNNVLANPVFNKAMGESGGKTSGHGGIVLYDDVDKLMDLSLFLANIGWKSINIKFSDSMRRDVWMPPESMCGGCPHILSCRGMVIT